MCVFQSCPNGGGLPGLPGITGRRGLKGNPGPGQAFNNWKQCVWNSADGGDAVTTIYVSIIFSNMIAAIPGFVIQQ